MDRKKAEALAQRVLVDTGGALCVALGYIGDRLGIFRAMGGGTAMTSAQIARRARLNERYVREWAKAMVAAEYLDYVPRTRRFRLSPEQQEAFLSEGSPLHVAGSFQFVVPTMQKVPRLLDAFRRGGGVRYDDLGEEVPRAIERMLAAGYRWCLAREWLPMVPGLVARLRRGIRVADIGCGRGQSTVAVASAFPASRILGIDSHAASIRSARRLARERGAANARFLVAPAQQVRLRGPFDAVCAFDCIHDMVDPRGALRAIRRSLSPDGVFLWSEPSGSDNPIENRNPIGKMLSACSPLHCMTVSLAHGGEGLGTIVGEPGLRALAREAGFRAMKRLPIDDPFHYHFAVRP